jgi:hypothetical protein
VRVTADEADAMAVGCGEAKCWAGPGKFCKTPSGTRRRPHPGRVQAARRFGLLGGAGRAFLVAQFGAVDRGGTVLVGPVALVLPPEAVTADAG